MNRLLLALPLAAACAHAPPRPTPQATDHVAAGAAALAAGQLERAEAEYQLALDYEPDLPEARNGLGLVAMARGEAPAARDHFQAALRAKPDFVEAHSNLGALEVKQGQLERSLPHFRAALAVDPGYAAARHNLARALAELGRHEASLAEYLKLTSTERRNADAWAELAAVNLALGRRGPAGEAVATALAIDGRHATARRLAANLDRDAGKLEAALAAYQALARELPDDALVLVDQGVALVLAHRAAEALPGLRRAAALAGDNATVRFALGVALVETGDDRAAAIELERAVALMQARGRDYPQARALLETLRKAP